MKRLLNEEDVDVVTESVQSPVIDWTRQDRQPSWQEKQERAQTVLRVEDSDGDPDGDDFILESRRQQQRLETPQRSDSGDKEPPGAPVKKRRRVLPWMKEGQEGQEKRPLVPTYVVSRSICTCDDGVIHGADDPVVRVEDNDSDNVSETDDCVEESERVSETEDSEEDDCSSFVVDDDSESVTEEENVSEKSLGRGALREVRVGIVERISKLRRRLKSVDEELSELTSVDGDTEEDEACWDEEAAAVWRKRVRSKCV
jgi:hypothetical protein